MVKGPALNKEEVGKISKKNLPRGQTGKRCFFVDTEKEGQAFRGTEKERFLFFG